MAFKFQLPKRKPKPKAEPKPVVDDVPGAGGRLSLIRLGVLVFVLTATITAGIAIFFQQDATSQSNASWQQEIALTAENLADRISTQLAQNAAKMELVARDAQLIELITLNDPDKLRKRETELAYLFPDSVRVRILPPGLTEVDLNSTPPLSYAALDMLRQAETSEEPPPAEVHLFGTPQQHITLVRRILSEGGRRIIGHLMVNFPLPAIQQAMDTSKLSRGYGEVWQVVSNSEPLVLARRGSAALREGDAAVVLDVPGSRWQIAYWSGGGGFTSSAEGLWVLAGSSIAVLGLLLALIFRTFARALIQDQVLILGAVRDARNGRLHEDYALALKETADTIKGIRKIYLDEDVAVQNRSVSPTVTARAAVSSASAAPVIMNKHANVGVDLGSPDVSGIAVSSSIDVDASIFRAYDIRGVVNETLTSEVVYEIGRAIGSEARARNQQTLIVGRDGRASGVELQDALVRGLRAAGVHVQDIGQVPTPVLYFATATLETHSGVIITGSHNPPEYNGMKIVLAGETLSGEAIQRLHERIKKGQFETGEGHYEALQIVDAYIERVRQDVQLSKPMRVVVDCGNGVAGAVAPILLLSLGCNVVRLYCDVDGEFPHHHPDPSKPENLADLIQAVRENKADVGLAFDGDGDRIGVVDSEGEILWPDRLMMLFAMDVLSRNPGAEIIFDVKSTRHLAQIVRDFGGSPEMWKTGHSLIKARMKETGALLAGELSGHIFIQERWYGFDDAMYAAARLLEMLSNDHRTSNAVFATLPDSVNTPELTLLMQEGEPQKFMQEFLEKTQFDGAEIVTIDGLRADFSDGWGLVRASNTMPNLVMRFEGDTQQALERVQAQFRRAMLAVNPKLSLPF